MINKRNWHTFFIPVMGTAFTIDCPIRVGQYGISSVVSINDDELCENMRKYFFEENELEYIPIDKTEDDFRAKRITAYLNLLNKILNKKFNAFKDDTFEPGSQLSKYFELLPDNSSLKKSYLKMLDLSEGAKKEGLKDKLRDQLEPGSIDVNIMTKVDRRNYDAKGESLPSEFSAALAALRGFAKSDLDAGIVFSAGFNGRLYSYCAEFDDFYPDEKGYLKKRIILKVSDYRSSVIQGRFLAKKGLWVSEHRIESGLNCGGHAFATEGNLLGPILNEYKQKKEALYSELYEICNSALQSQKRSVFTNKPCPRLTVQGGIGTAKEHEFLLEYYQVDGVGWATPFLLVPEVTVLDDDTRKLLVNASENDLYLSKVSPLGVAFNNVIDSASELNQTNKTKKGKPGSACPKGYLVSNTEFSERPICTASRVYQKLKLEQLKELKLKKDKFQDKFQEIVAKVCLCEDLAASALIQNGIKNGRALITAVCPGPNLAYFSKIATLKEMVSHIYGKINLLNEKYRPSFLIKELKMYIEYIEKEIIKALPEPTAAQIKYLNNFKANLNKGIEYYKELIPKLFNEAAHYKEAMKNDLLALKERLEELAKEHSAIFNRSSLMSTASTA